MLLLLGSIKMLASLSSLFVSLIDWCLSHPYYIYCIISTFPIMLLEHCDDHKVTVYILFLKPLWNSLFLESPFTFKIQEVLPNSTKILNITASESFFSSDSLAFYISESLLNCFPALQKAGFWRYPLIFSIN